MDPTATLPGQRQGSAAHPLPPLSSGPPLAQSVGDTLPVSPEVLVRVGSPIWPPVGHPLQDSGARGLVLRSKRYRSAER